MKNEKIITLLILALCMAFSWTKVGDAAPLGTAFTYQGHLYDANQAANNIYDLQFKLYDANIAGTQKGSNVDKSEVEVIDGYFTVNLDFGTSVFDGNAVWLQIGVRQGNLSDPNVYTILVPRQLVSPTPYAIYAKSAGTGGDLTIPVALAGNGPYTVFSATNAGTGKAIIGQHQGTGNFGALGASDAGVRGGSPTGHAVYGESGAGEGVYGYGTYGVYGVNSGGKYGYLGGSQYGVYGKGTVYGESSMYSSNFGYLGGNSVGAYAQSRYGTIAHLASDNAAVYGLNPTGWAINGESSNSAGVRGKSTTGYGVTGESTDGYGVYGTSTTSYGVAGKRSGAGPIGFLGLSGAGVRGQNSSGTSFGEMGLSDRGVFGRNETNYGVWGESVSGTGLYGVSSSGYGVHGHTTTGTAVFGDNGTSLGYLGAENAAVRGEWGVLGTYGELGAFGNYGVHGYSSVGKAGYFEGDVTVYQGDLSIFEGKIGIGIDIPNQELAVEGNVYLNKNDGTLTLRTPTQNDAGRYKINFSNNNLAVFTGEDFENQIFAFYTKWSNSRKYDAKIQIHGSSTSTWGNYLGLTHDGTNGIINTDTGHLILSPAQNVGIGTTSPTEKLDVEGTARLRGIGSSTGTTVVVDATGKLYKQSSSLRYKTNIETLDTGMNAVLNLRPVRFTYKESGQKDIGLIAEEVEKISPDLVIYDTESRPDAVKYDKVALYLLSLLKEQQKENEDIKLRLAAIEALIAKSSLQQQGGKK